MKIAHVPQIVFDEEEIEALHTIARIDCEGFNCEEDNCPFNWATDSGTAHCIKMELKKMMVKRGI